MVDPDWVGMRFALIDRINPMIGIGNRSPIPTLLAEPSARESLPRRFPGQIGGMVRVCEPTTRGNEERIRQDEDQNAHCDSADSGSRRLERRRRSQWVSGTIALG